MSNFRLQVTSNTRANGQHVPAGEILTEAQYGLDTLKAINGAGKGRWMADDETEPEAPRRGRPKKEHAEA